VSAPITTVARITTDDCATPTAARLSSPTRTCTGAGLTGVDSNLTALYKVIS